jgi:hypothetical protein
MAAGFAPWRLFALPPPANERGSDDDDEDDQECQQELGHAGLHVFSASMLIEKGGAVLERRQAASSPIDYPCTLHPSIARGEFMAKPNYSFQKKQRELAAKKKREEKQQRRQQKKEEETPPPAEG